MNGIRRVAQGQVVSEVLEAAAGRERRADPVLPVTGGPAGNARLTAWTGLILLPLSLAELATLLAVRQLISWHIVIGVLLAPPALLKTGTTGWRILRYYRGNRPYRQGGPPPMLLRLLGPLVVGGTLAVLASGLVLIGLGRDGGRSTLVQVLGLRVSALTLHQASFIVWAVATGLHVLARTVPAFQLATERSPRPGVPGRGRRITALVLTCVVAAAAASLVLAASGSWTHQPLDRFGQHQDRHGDDG